MQRLTGEDGAVAVLVAVTLVVMLGLSALVLDVGNLYWERRQLQNGADAAALAAAQDIVDGSGATALATARQYADSNNSRGAYIDETDVVVGTNSVTVTTQTGSAAGPGQLTSILAGVLGVDQYATSATATASWGTFGGGATVPLTFSLCEWDQMTGGDVGNLPTAERTVYFHSSQTAASINSCGGPANQNHPGGFGWLTTNGPEPCSSMVELGMVDTDTGNNVPQECSAAFFQGLLGGGPVLLPVFDEVLTPQGSNARYRIVGFAALEVTGYRFSGNPAFNSSPAPCSGNDRCISGRFVAYYDLGSQPVTGGTDLGAYVIGLTG